MEELKNEEVLTEEIQEEETTEIFEPDVDDIIPAEEIESKGSNGAVLFVAGALAAGVTVGIVKLVHKFGQKRKPKKEEKDSNEDWDDDEVFEEDDDPEIEEETETKKK